MCLSPCDPSGGGCLRMAQSRCSVCGKLFDADESSTLPFCSRRCKQIDLGRWLDERYGLPYESEEGDEPRPAPPETPGDEEE